MDKPIHKEITKNAFQSKSYLSSAALDLICEGDEDGDKIPHNTFIVSQHFDDCCWQEGINFLKRSRALAVQCFLGEYAENQMWEKERLMRVKPSPGIGPPDRLIQMGLYAVGRHFHAIQDFYSHSNWTSLTGPKADPEYWREESIDPGCCKYARDLKTSFFSLLKWAGSKVGSVGSKLEALTYLKDPQGWLKEVKDSSIKSDHSYMNLDHPKTIADRCYFQCFGKSGFEAAKAAATAHTSYAWDRIVEGVNVGSKTDRQRDWIWRGLKLWEKRQETLELHELRTYFKATVVEGVKKGVAS